MSSIQMRGITKRFPGVVANDSVDLDLYEGEVHGLLGENGAGKTTLMNVLFGLYQPDEGQILLNEQSVSIHSPADAIELGIGMIHQHFKLVGPFTVAENIILGLQGSLFVDMKEAQRDIAKVAEQYGLQVDLGARVQELSVGEQQRAEILSSLYRGAQVLILDEPTAVLTPQEADNLSVILREMARQSKTIVFISHKLDEVLKVTDRVTVLRAGRVVFSALTKDTTKQEMAREMIGRELGGLRSEQAAVVLALAGAEDATLAGEKLTYDSEPVLEAIDLYLLDDRSLPAVRGVDVTVHKGEILGIAGVDGNGQHELVEGIVRLRPLQRGQIRIGGEDATSWGVRNAIAHNVAYISDDRHNEGLILGFDLSRNAVIKLFERGPFSRRGLLDYDEIDRFTESLIEEFDVRTPGPRVAAATLSGGNQQKLILARELSQQPDLIIANKPTRGLDIGAAAYVHERLLAERERGAGILLLSADLDEILLLSDRILVMYNGNSMGVLERHSADVQTIGLMMAGTPLSSLEEQGTIS